MKKGCFVSTIAALTIFVAAALYIIQNHLYSFIINPGKKIVAKFIKNELDAKLEIVIDSPEKTELKRMIKELSESPEKLKSFNENELKELMSAIDAAISDSIIQKSELENISKLINQLQNERSKKN